MKQTTEIAQEISRLFGKGLYVSAETLFFAESTYGIKKEMLAPALEDDLFEGREALTELILTPEPDVRMAIEPLLPDTGLTESAIIDIGTALANSFASVDLIIPGVTVRQTISIDRNGIHLFLHKCYLKRSLDKVVVAPIEQLFSTGTVVASRVVMRCRNARFDTVKREFMCRFITRCAAYESRFEEFLVLILTLLAGIDDGQDVEPFLLRKKQEMISTLKEIQRFAGMQDRYSMEYLMMQRFKVPPESEDEVLNRLYLLTTVTDVILGLPPDPSLRVEEKDLGDFAAAGGLEILIRTLS